MIDPQGEFVRAMAIRAYACHLLFAGDRQVLGTLPFASTRREDRRWPMAQGSWLLSIVQLGCVPCTGPRLPTKRIVWSEC